ncbi:MAG: glutamine-hydrolyzing carbamoyl-phosphate synthase small subunit [Clostridia bacterium]|nr:glutamine-hydrolyzing carbamoyl-phosphate synthase small subunit [Clostridia bacterium]
MAVLILEDGSRFEGTLFGHKKAVSGEVVFTTGMCGYQHTLTDPAYRGQIVCMTYPLIGNVGVNDLDFESGAVQTAGVIVSELCEVPSNWQLKKSLDEYLDEQGVTGVCGVDTRALTRHIRTHGAMRGWIVEDGQDAASVGESKSDLIMEATCKQAYDVSMDGDVKIAVLDLGMKRSLTDWIVKKGAKVTVFPAGASAEEILNSGCDGVLISCGSGDPNNYPQIVETVKALMGMKPVMGVGTGHLMMALSAGCKVSKMLYGHHGSNQPVKDLARGTCAVTSQAIGYAVDGESLGEGVTVSHINWNDKTVEGLKYAGKAALSVAFVPGGLGGRFDTTYLFDEFLAMVRRAK